MNDVARSTQVLKNSAVLQKAATRQFDRISEAGADNQNFYFDWMCYLVLHNARRTLVYQSFEYGRMEDAEFYAQLDKATKERLEEVRAEVRKQTVS